MRKLRIEVVNNALELTWEMKVRNYPSFLILHFVTLSLPPTKIKYEYNFEFLYYSRSTGYRDNEK